MSYKASTLASMFFSILSTIVFLLVWWLLYNQYEEINGYRFEDACLMLGTIWCVFGIVHTFLGGIGRTPDYVQRGNFIELQLFPYPSFLLLSLKGLRIASFADLILGIASLAYYFSVGGGINIFILIGIIIFAAVGIYGFYLLMGALTLFFPGAGFGIMNAFWSVMIGPSFYSYGNFPRALRIFLWFTSTIPVIVLPIEVIRGTFSMQWLVVSWAVSCFVLWLAVFTWVKGEKRVESGSF